MTRERGQAVVEMAMVVPIMLVIIFGFLGLLLWEETAHDLRAATALASTTAATFRDDSGAAVSAEGETFYGTMRQYSYVEVGSFTCSHAGTRVTCTASAVLRFDRTPLAVAWPTNPRMNATAVSYSSEFRTQ
jgi:Flp pilus assembly protein TadG